MRLPGLDHLRPEPKPLPRGVVDYADLVAATEIVDDNDCDPPWENCDGWKHDVTTHPRCHARWVDLPPRCLYEQQGYVSCSRSWGGSPILIVPDREDTNWDSYEYCRKHYGYSKQVAREHEAERRRRTLKQLVDWYSNGWEYYGVSCQYTAKATFGDDFEVNESLCGIDDLKYAQEEVVPDIVGQAVWSLEKAGFVVENQPEEKPRPRRRQNYWITQMAFGFHTDEAYWAWLRSRPRWP